MGAILGMPLWAGLQSALEGGDVLGTDSFFCADWGDTQVQDWELRRPQDRWEIV
jgi:hypothetical protein